MDLLSHLDVVNAFGGVRPLAEAIGVSPKRAIHWGRRGIPSKYWLLVAETQKGREIGLTVRKLMMLPAIAGSGVEAAA